MTEKKKTYLVVAPGEFHEGRSLFQRINDPLSRDGRTLKRGIHGTYPESFAREVATIREELGKLDVLVYVATPRRTSSSPMTTARDLASEFGRQIVGLVNACTELREVFTTGAKIFVVITEPQSYSTVHQTVAGMMYGVLELLRRTSTLEHLQLEQLEFREWYDHRGYASNFGEILDRITRALQSADQESAVTSSSA